MALGVIWRRQSLSFELKGVPIKCRQQAALALSPDSDSAASTHTHPLPLCARVALFSRPFVSLFRAQFDTENAGHVAAAQLVSVLRAAGLGASPRALELLLGAKAMDPRANVRVGWKELMQLAGAPSDTVLLSLRARGVMGWGRHWECFCVECL
eukprot:6200859-Pleurochrysis_carterae.AAC.1